MSSFSNTDTGNKPADPYTEANKDEASLQDKVETLTKFVSSCKFGMMTTRDATSDKLASRAMAVAATVCPSPAPKHSVMTHTVNNISPLVRNPAASTSSSSPIRSRTRRTS